MALTSFCITMQQIISYTNVCKVKKCLMFSGLIRIQHGWKQYTPQLRLQTRLGFLHVALNELTITIHKVQ